MDPLPFPVHSLALAVPLWCPGEALTVGAKSLLPFPLAPSPEPVRCLEQVNVW